MTRSGCNWLRTALTAVILALPLPGLAAPRAAAMPAEYAAVIAIVNRLAAANNLGDRELAFTIVSGDYAAWMAQDLGLCKQDDCNYYFSLNPFIRHRNEVGEIVRQAYLYGDANAQAHTNGTIEIPRVSFRIYNSRHDLLACTIAHEIAHARDAHTFQHTEALSIQGRGMSEASRKLLNYEINRDFELLADQQAWEMTVRAGYPADTCEQDLRFLHRSSGNGGVTEPDSSHPGLQERIEKLNAYIAGKPEGPAAEAPTNGRWSYDSELNLLRFQPLAPTPASP